MTGVYRKLTNEEVFSYVDELRQNKLEESIRQYARTVYGEKAEKVYLEYDSEYNDEGGYYSRIRGIYVVDKDGNDLEFVPNLPEVIKSRYHDFGGATLTSEVDVDHLEDGLSEYRYEIIDLSGIEFDDLPNTVFVRELPSFPVFFVEV